jgi:hypothetical protein
MVSSGDGESGGSGSGSGGGSGSTGGGDEPPKGSGGKPPEETFTNPADAIGDIHGKADWVGQGSTKSDYWNAQGYTETHYYLDSCGDQHTVFYNPTTRLFSGGHLSSGQMTTDMPRTIEATLPSESEPAFRTPGEAVDFSKSIDRTRHHDDMALCVGRIIWAVDWRDDSFSLHLDNHKVLQFGCAQNVVDVIIGDDQPNTVVGGPQTQEVVLVHLNGREIHWKRDELMRALQGNTVDRIQMGKTGLFLYVKNVGILAVNVLIDRSTGRPFLFWEMVD